MVLLKKFYQTTTDNTLEAKIKQYEWICIVIGRNDTTYSYDTHFIYTPMINFNITSTVRLGSQNNYCMIETYLNSNNRVWINTTASVTEIYGVTGLTN